MVNFAQHLKGPRQAEDPSIIRGTLTAHITPSIKGRKPYDRECEWEISPYAAYGGPSTTFWITKGGVTGYESFTLRDPDQVLNLHTLCGIFDSSPGGRWCACFGSGGWDKMEIPDSELRAAIQQWLDREGIDLSKEIA